MENRAILKAGILLFIGTVLLSFAQWHGIQGLTERHDVSTARRLDRAAAFFIQHAHQSNDDLLLQQIVQATAQVPGISFAAITDTENKILAHNEPAKLGQTLRLHSGLWVYPLESGRDEWGKFVFGFSDSLFHQTALRENVTQIFLLMIFMFALLGIFIAVERKRQSVQAQTSDLEAMLAEEKARSSRLETKTQTILTQGQSWLCEAMGRFPHPALFLDGRQRVYAINAGALECLGMSSPKDVLGKSWHEFPLLNSFGADLERSLASPGRSVMCSAPGGELQLTFDTNPSGMMGTWVTLFALRVVE